MSPHASLAFALRASVATLLAIALPLSSAHAQCEPSLSFLANAPAGLSFSRGAANVDPARPYFQELGIAVDVPAPWSEPAALAPNFDFLNHIDPGSSGCQIAPGDSPDINALSLGQDFWIINDLTGTVELPFDRWAVVQFSVKSYSRVEPGTRVAVEVNEPDGGGLDLFTHAFEGSALPPDIEGGTFRSHDAKELGVDDSFRDIDALDHQMSLYTLDPGLANLMPDDVQIFFSVSAETLDQAPACWFSPPTAVLPKSAATILVTDWNPTTGLWSTPHPFKIFTQLGLQIDEDIDALSIDLERQRIVFSTTTDTRDELLFLPCSPFDGLPPVPMPLKDPVERVTGKIGIPTDGSIDAVCGIDPSLRRGTAGPAAVNPWNYYCGTPSGPRFLPPNGGAELSAFRLKSSTGGPQLNVQLTGFPPVTGERPGIAIIAFSPPGVTTALFPLAEFARTIPVPICGDPKVWRFEFPATAVLSDYAIDVRGIVADLALTEIYDTHPLRIRF